ncbi:MAG: EVE domain-containing protein [Cereibacter sphaeroides]|uniref:UPF0310 protein DI533_00080 n=1 Tax=Cereibacter sphaeroides TaxID=1063 RepID=A0A2W5TT81_CERSP|nr:MAG: EVE domain-containing protein [Cereibacter sphaeroides]
MRNWIGVASADHVAVGRAQGFMQVNHGKAAPLRRMAAADMIAYYSPVQTFGTRTPLQAFTAIGKVRDSEIYQGFMAEGFVPYRRDVEWLYSEVAQISPLLDRLEFTAGRKNWGYALRFGLIEVGEGDMRLIAESMGAGL